MRQKEQLEGMFKRLEGKSEDEQRAAVKAFSTEEQELLKVQYGTEVECMRHLHN